jgi:putative PIN family toxin of toxin-antitoxin system
VRVVLDSSVLIAAYVTRAGVCAELYEEILQHHELVLSPTILDEVERKLRTKFLIADSLIARTLSGMTRAAEVVDPAPVASTACRDADDLHILGTAVAGRAEFLVSVDNDLLELGTFKSIKIIRPGEFWRRG